MNPIDAVAAQQFDPQKMRKVNLFETADMFCDVYCLLPGQSQRPHTHDDATKFYYVIDGRGWFQIGEREVEAGPGSVVFAPRGEMHGVENRSKDKLVLLVAMAPNPNTKPGT